jgi:hypothetical protein
MDRRELVFFIANLITGETVYAWAEITKKFKGLGYNVRYSKHDQPGQTTDRSLIIRYDHKGCSPLQADFILRQWEKSNRHKPWYRHPTPKR